MNLGLGPVALLRVGGGGGGGVWALQSPVDHGLHVGGHAEDAAGIQQTLAEYP